MGQSLSLVYIPQQQESDMSPMGDFGIIRAMRSSMSLVSLKDSSDEELPTPPDSAPTTHLCLEDVAGSFTEDRPKPRLRRISSFSSQSMTSLRKVSSSLVSPKKPSPPVYLRSVGSLNQLNLAGAPGVVERCMTCCDLRAEYRQLKRTGRCVYQAPAETAPEPISVCLRCNTFIVQMVDFP